ncbi:MAG TPA: hypothetical protein VH559_13025 [Gemmatimonadaceae bacterium]
MKLLEFKDGDLTFTCEAKSSPATPGTVWRWMSVTGESQRYAAFRAVSGDTRADLRQRILAFYANLLAERARPREVRGHWGTRRPAQAAASTPDAAPDGTSSPADSTGTPKLQRPFRQPAEDNQKADD